MHSYPTAHCLSRDRSRNFTLSLHGTVSVLSFATKEQARQCIRPNRVQHCFVYGLVFCVRTSNDLRSESISGRKTIGSLELRAIDFGIGHNFHPSARSL